MNPISFDQRRGPDFFGTLDVNIDSQPVDNQPTEIIYRQELIKSEGVPLKYVFPNTELHISNKLPIEPDFSAKALDAHWSTLQHHDFTREMPRLMLFFSGTPGMGKTTLSKLLEKTLLGIRISNDESRKHLRSALQKKHALDSEIKLATHTYNLLTRIDSHSKNHLIIMDSTIDGGEQEAKELAHSLGYDMFVIRLVVSKDAVIERLKQREQDPSVHLSRLERWWKTYQSVDLKYVDYSFDASSALEELNLSSLIEAIHKKIQILLPTSNDIPQDGQ